MGVAHIPCMLRGLSKGLKALISRPMASTLAPKSVGVRTLVRLFVQCQCHQKY